MTDPLAVDFGSSYARALSLAQALLADGELVPDTLTSLVNERRRPTVVPAIEVRFSVPLVWQHYLSENDEPFSLFTVELTGDRPEARLVAVAAALAALEADALDVGDHLLEARRQFDIPAGEEPWLVARVRARLLEDMRVILNRVEVQEIGSIRLLEWEILIAFCSCAWERLGALLERYFGLSRDPARRLAAGRLLAYSLVPLPSLADTESKAARLGEVGLVADAIRQGRGRSGCQLDPGLTAQIEASAPVSDRDIREFWHGSLFDGCRGVLSEAAFNPDDLVHVIASELVRRKGATLEESFRDAPVHQQQQRLAERIGWLRRADGAIGHLEVALGAGELDPVDRDVLAWAYFARAIRASVGDEPIPPRHDPRLDFRRAADLLQETATGCPMPLPTEVFHANRTFHLLAALRRSGDGAAALRIVQDELSRKPDDPDLLEDQARIFDDLGRHKDAYDSLVRAFELRDKDADPLHRILLYGRGIPAGLSQEQLSELVAALPGHERARIAAAARTFWATFDRLTQNGRDDVVAALILASDRAVPQNEVRALQAWAMAVECELRDTVFEPFKRSVSARFTGRARGGGGTWSLEAWLSGASRSPTLRQMSICLNDAIRHGTLSLLKVWVDGRCPGFRQMQFLKDLESLCGHRNDAAHDPRRVDSEAALLGIEKAKRVLNNIYPE